MGELTKIQADLNGYVKIIADEYEKEVKPGSKKDAKAVKLTMAQLVQVALKEHIDCYATPSAAPVAAAPACYPDNFSSCHVFCSYPSAAPTAEAAPAVTPHLNELIAWGLNNPQVTYSRSGGLIKPRMQRLLEGLKRILLKEAGAFDFSAPLDPKTEKTIQAALGDKLKALDPTQLTDHLKFYYDAPLPGHCLPLVTTLTTNPPPQRRSSFNGWVPGHEPSAPPLTIRR